MELAEKDIKTAIVNMLHMLRKIEENINMMRKEMNILKKRSLNRTSREENAL